MAELVAVAERLGAPVISRVGHDAWPAGVSGRSSAYRPRPCRSGRPKFATRLADFDVLLVVGMDLLRQYVYLEPSRAMPEHVRIVHLDEDPWQLGKNYPVEVG